MPVFFYPDNPERYVIIAGVLILLVLGVMCYQWLFPPRAEVLLKDERYRVSQRLYIDRLSFPDPTSEDRQHALEEAVEMLIIQGIPREQAPQDLRHVVAEHDRARSYDVRSEAMAYEQMGAYELALDRFERAAMWQADHDAGDYAFLQRCIERVRNKKPRT